MIIDITGTTLVPSSNGEDCPGNGKQLDHDRNVIECCCDECDYYLFCFPEANKRII